MSGTRAKSVGLVFGGIVSVQFGAAAASGLFDQAGPVGTTFVRLTFAALVLIAIWRPSVRALRAAGGRDVLWFGATLAAMNTCFYLSIDRIPLGIAVALEFVGPLGVAFAASRRRSDALWALLAATGIVLLAPTPGGDLDLVGCALALVAGVFWGAYILLSARVGRFLPGGDGLALAMGFAALLALVPGVVDGGSGLLKPEVLGVGFAVAILSSAIPYSLELEALRHLPQGTFGVLMSLEPAVAATVGLIALDQGLAPNEVAAIAFVVVASAGALRTAAPPVEV